MLMGFFNSETITITLQLQNNLRVTYLRITIYILQFTHYIQQTYSTLLTEKKTLTDSLDLWMLI